jgi:uncharacterized membrane protein
VGTEVLELAFRWAHVVAAALWVGLTWTAAWVLPRPLRESSAARLAGWLRSSALAAWLGGAALLFLLHYSGAYAHFLEDGAPPSAGDWVAPFLALGAAYAIYELPVSLGEKRGAKAVAEVGPLALLAAAVAFSAWLEARGASRRAVMVHVGAFLATGMLGNTWLRIAPALRGGAGALLRTRHGARVFVPLFLVMVSSDEPSLAGLEPWLGALAGLLGAGYLLGWWIERALPLGPTGQSGRL